MTDNDITALVGSRICHDLISPLGAIGNGLELLQMGGGPDTPELSLISDSLDSATARIRFFRIAFGDAKAGQTVGRNEIDSALRHGFANSRLTLRFDPEDLDRLTARLLFLTLQCLETAMPYGGTIAITHRERHLIVTGTAERFAVEEALWASLTASEGSYELRPALVQFALLRSHAKDEDRDLRITQEGTRLTVAL